jgi:hypothetical protein
MQTVLTDEQKIKMKEVRMKMKRGPAGPNAPAGSAVPQQQ